MTDTNDQFELNSSELLVLHQTYVQTITSNESRRQQLSSLYLSLIAGGVAYLGSDSNVNPVFVIAPIFIISLIWFFSIRYFRLLAKAKFKTLEELENKFDIMPFSIEWDFFSKKKPIGLTLLDMAVPLFIAVSSFGFLITQFLKVMCAP